MRGPVPTGGTSLSLAVPFAFCPTSLSWSVYSVVLSRGSLTLQGRTALRPGGVARSMEKRPVPEVARWGWARGLLPMSDPFYLSWRDHRQKTL